MNDWERQTYVRTEVDIQEMLCEFNKCGATMNKETLVHMLRTSEVLKKVFNDKDLLALMRKDSNDPLRLYLPPNMMDWRKAKYLTDCYESAIVKLDADIAALEPRRLIAGTPNEIFKKCSERACIRFALAEVQAMNIVDIREMYRYYSPMLQRYTELLKVRYQIQMMVLRRPVVPFVPINGGSLEPQPLSSNGSEELQAPQTAQKVNGTAAPVNRARLSLADMPEILLRDFQLPSSVWQSPALAQGQENPTGLESPPAAAEEEGPGGEL